MADQGGMYKVKGKRSKAKGGRLKAHGEALTIGVAAFLSIPQSEIRNPQ
jgi:hypothetical protein